ncbi:MAG: ABC-type uncharacterized transport system [Firmicutes bacterium ADurb.Bin193]|nr:MAG: ABC-type uncharacterized transport system [Firmicutes bacterium ADurb.Bin193]
MNKIKRFFTDKRLIYGSGSAAMTAGFIAVMVLVNIIVGVLSDKFTLKIDLTENRIYKLSNETVSIVKAVSSPVRIILFETDGGSNPRNKEILERYTALNKNLNLSIVDPVKNPVEANKYKSKAEGGITNGTIVVDNGTRFKVIPAEELNVYNQQIGALEYITTESKITSALLSLSKSADMKVAFSTDHGETPMSSLEAALLDDNIVSEKVTTLTEGFSENYDMYIIVSPKTDFTAEEIDSLDNYLKAGKNAQIYFGADTPKLPRLESYLYDMGISVGEDVIVETDSRRIVYNTPYCFVPVIKEHAATKPYTDNRLNVVTYLTRTVKPLWSERDLILLETLLESSDKSRSGADESVNGPFPLCVMATRSIDSGVKSRVLVMGSAEFLDETFSTANKDFILGSISWQIDDTSVLSILPKNVLGTPLELTLRDFQLWQLVLIVFVPITVLMFGLATWMRRRHL